MSDEPKTDDAPPIIREDHVQLHLGESDYFLADFGSHWLVHVAATLTQNTLNAVIRECPALKMAMDADPDVRQRVLTAVGDQSYRTLGNIFLSTGAAVSKRLTEYEKKKTPSPDAPTHVPGPRATQ